MVQLFKRAASTLGNCAKKAVFDIASDHIPLKATGEYLKSRVGKQATGSNQTNSTLSNTLSPKSHFCFSGIKQFVSFHGLERFIPARFFLHINFKVSLLAVNDPGNVGIVFTT